MCLKDHPFYPAVVVAVAAVKKTIKTVQREVCIEIIINNVVFLRDLKNEIINLKNDIDKWDQNSFMLCSNHEDN